MRNFIPLAWIALLVWVPSAGAEETADAAKGHSKEAIEILKKADEAIKKVSGVRFKSKLEPQGMATNFVSYAEGSGHMVGYNGGIPQKFYGTVTTSRVGSEDKLMLEGGGDGDTYFLIDHSTKKGYEDMDPGVMGSTGNMLQNIGMIEFVHEAPFDDELSAETIELAEPTKVGDEPCRQVRVVYSGGRGESTWAFSENDDLPRRRVRHFSSPQGSGSITITILSLEINPKVDSADYKMKLPEGYEQIDDFAP